VNDSVSRRELARSPNFVLKLVDQSSQSTADHFTNHVIASRGFVITARPFNSTTKDGASADRHTGLSTRTKVGLVLGFSLTAAVIAIIIMACCISRKVVEPETVNEVLLFIERTDTVYVEITKVERCLPPVTLKRCEPGRGRASTGCVVAELSSEPYR
jgi:hypothetical protein